MTYLGKPIGYFSITENQHGKTKWLNLLPENTEWKTQFVDIDSPQNYEQGFYSLPITGVMCFQHDGKEFKQLDWVYQMYDWETKDLFKNKFFVSYEAKQNE